MTNYIITPNIFLLLILLFTISCQKSPESLNNKEAAICPEVKMKNYEEAGLIINDFLNEKSTPDDPNNIGRLTNYLEDCGCIEKVSVTSNLISGSPAVEEYYIRFVSSPDKADKVLNVVVNKENKLEVRQIHDL